MIIGAASALVIFPQLVNDSSSFMKWFLLLAP
jgi:hypothetical protein